MDNRTFASQFLEPKRTGNFIKDLNPLSKLNIFLSFGLSALILGDYRYGFGLVVFMLAVAVLAQCLGSYLKVYWKILLFFGVFLFGMKAAFSPGEQIIWQKWGIHVSVARRRIPARRCSPRSRRRRTPFRRSPCAPRGPAGAAGPGPAPPLYCPTDHPLHVSHSVPQIAPLVTGREELFRGNFTAGEGPPPGRRPPLKKIWKKEKL